MNMKNIYLSLTTIALSYMAFAQNGQIQNGGFENWTNTTIFDYPTIWGSSNVDQFQGVPSVIKSTDAQLGTYSAELIAAEVGPNPDTTFGYVFHGTLTPGAGPSAGIPYTNAFNEVKFHYKCDMPIGDTLYMLLIRFNMGVMTDVSIQPAAYGTHSTWTQGSVMVSVNPQDQIFLAFIMQDVFNNGPTPTPGSWARIDNVHMFNMGIETTNVPDPSFESWSSQSIETPDSWFSLDEMLASSGLENANKTTDFNSGAYALELSTVQDPISLDTIRGFVSVGPILFGGPNPFMPIPYNASPTTFSGAYRYAPSNGDQGVIVATFFQMGAVIGQHSEPCYTNSTYTTFSAPLTIVGTPDSMSVFAFSGNNPGSVLFVDDLAFSGGNVSIEEFAASSISIYPNPANDIVMIKAEGVYKYELLNVYGAVVRSNSNVTGAQIINVSDLSAGTYFVKMINATSTEIQQLVVE
jgi:hypothetical protein